MTDRFFRQPIDHFRPSLGTFDQRYYVRDSYVKTGATSTPLLLFLGGEAPLDGPPAPGSFVDTLARRHNALLVALEHRFYGRSIPFDELTTRNLRLLSLKQILADVGAFCEGYAKAVSTALGPGALLPDSSGWAPPPSRWVVVGGSYAGALAAWSAARHPSLVAGAIASSAVVAPALEVPEFDLAAGRVAGAPCAAAIRAVSRALDAALAGDVSDRTRRLFGARQLSDGELRLAVADALSAPLMFGRRGEVCEPLVRASGGGAALLLAAAANHTRSRFLPTLAYGADEYSLGFLSETAAHPRKSARQWLWQRCSELGLWQTAAARMPLRSPKLTLPYFRSACVAAFASPGDDEEKGVVWPDADALRKRYTEFGANVVFTYGSEDPWRTAGAATGHPLVIDCDGCAHCAELGAPADDDPPQLAAARDAIDAQLGEWLRGTETRPGATGEDDPVVASVLRMAGEALAESAS